MMESELEWAAWADLPAELLSTISNYLKEAPDITSFHGVCRSWRSSSVMPIPINKISPLFPRRLNLLDDSLDCNAKSHPKYLIANAVYPVRSKKATAAPFMVSIQESKPGKLLLRNALTYERIADPFPHSSSPTTGYELDFSSRTIRPISISHNFQLDLSDWTLTPIAISHKFHCPDCGVVSTDKVVLVPNPDPGSPFAAVFSEYSGLRRCLSIIDNIATSSHLVGGSDSLQISDFVKFNVRLYAIDTADRVYLLDHIGSNSRLLPLPCDKSIHNVFGVEPNLRRFVVSDGGLYLVLGLCERILDFARHRFHIYKLVMDDINNVTHYSLEKVENLGDRLFFINQDCSFSVTARDLLLPPPLLGNCIVVARFKECDCFGDQEFYVHHPGGPQGHPERKVPRTAYSALFKPPPLWICANKQKQRKKKENKLKLLDRFGYLIIPTYKRS